MLEAPVGSDDAERVARLRGLGLLDTAAEERFDRITRIAGLALGAPIALVSLVDAHRQWFKSRVGLDASETPRSVSFCGHAIHSDEPLVVPDALADPRFADNPLVLGAPHVRAYVGFPLGDGDGHNLGTLCVIDHEARSFPPDKLAIMAELAAWAELELRSIGLDQALRERNDMTARAEVIAESVIDALITVDDEGIISSFNSSAEQMFGYRRDEVVGGSVTLLAPPSSAGEGPAAREGLGRRRDGSLFPMELSTSRAEVGGAPLNIWLARDITERHATQEALRQSEEIHRAVIDNMDEGVLIYDREGRLLANNAAAERILGERAASMGEPRVLWSDAALLREDGTAFPDAERPVILTLDHGRSCAGVIVGLPRDGMDVRWVSVNSQALVREGESRPWGVSCTFADVSDRLIVDRMKSEFVSVVSHELRTPLTSIRGALGLLAGGALGALGERAQRMLDIAVTNTDRLVRLINDILDIERIESGQVRLDKRLCDPANLVAQAIEVTQALAQRAGVIVSWRAEPTELVADPDRVVQTLTNLLSNAIKFSPPGASIHVSAARERDAVRFAVTDEGRGIPPDKLEAIFGRFQQVDASDSRDKGGTGLGLAICRSIVEQHGGRIGVESTLGRGSTFSFTIPGGIDARPVPAARSPHGGFTVLVCDDDDDVRATIAAILATTRCTVLAARTGEEALRLAQARRPDVLLLDLGLPGLSGWQTMATMHADPSTRNIPVVIVTGAPHDEDGEGHGEAGWVEKPFHPETLLRAVYHAIDVSPSPARVLVVEDDTDLGCVLSDVFTEHGIETRVAPTVRDAIEIVDTFRPQLMLLDLNLPDGNGLSVIEAMDERGDRRATPAVVYTAGPVGAEDYERGQAQQAQFLFKGATDPEALAGHVTRLLMTYAGQHDKRPT
jgi:PAS domain S-box-containing protein